jgi:hypothetical protein
MKSSELKDELEKFFDEKERMKESTREVLW